MSEITTTADPKNRPEKPAPDEVPWDLLLERGETPRHDDVAEGYRQGQVESVEDLVWEAQSIYGVHESRKTRLPDIWAYFRFEYDLSTGWAMDVIMEAEAEELIEVFGLAVYRM